MNSIVSILLIFLLGFLLPLKANLFGHGGAGGLLLIRETKGNITTDLYPLYDGSGNVTALSNSTGTLLAEYAYGPFGELIYARGPKAQSCPFRFATKYYDQETGYYNFGRRFYDPVTGQFLSREPLGENESLNLYSYCHNDPINYVDVLGLRRINTQDAANDQRVEWLLMQLAAGSGLPTAPLDVWKLYFPESSDFGLYKPYGQEDYKRAQAFVQNLGRPSFSSMTSEQSASANRPLVGPAPKWLPSATAALTLGAANTPLNARINSDWLLPSGAGAAGAKFLFGGMKAMLPVLAAGVRTEARVLTAEMQMGEVAAKGGGTRLLGLPTPTGVASEGGVIRAFAQQGHQTYYRVFSGNQQGSWLTAVPPKSSAWAQEALALPSENTASFIQEVLVPAGTQLQRSRALPAFGRGGGAEQFKLLEHISSGNFGMEVPFK